MTLGDPSSGGTADLLEAGRDPWRPSRRQVVAVVASGLVAALVAGAVVQVRHTRREDALDAAAVRDVTLSLGTAQARFDVASDEELEVTVELANHGALPLRVLGVRVAGEGYPGQAHDLVLLANSRVPVTLRPRPCSPAVLTTTPSQVVVQVRTERGEVVRRTLDLPPETATEIAQVHQRQCGYLPPDEALGSELLSATRQGRDVVAVVALSNASVRPLTVTGVEETAGLRVTAGFPVTIPARAGPREEMPQVELVLRLRVTDCQYSSVGGVYGDVGWSLIARVRSGQQDGQAMIPLTPGPGVAPGDAPDAAQLLLDGCPGFFGH